MAAGGMGCCVQEVAWKRGNHQLQACELYWHSPPSKPPDQQHPSRCMCVHQESVVPAAQPKGASHKAKGQRQNPAQAPS